MPFVLVLIGLVLLISAIKNTQGNLASALEQDIPGFAKWFGAVALVGGLGYIPGMQLISRWLLALVMVVLVLANYTKIFAGLQNAFATASSSTVSTSQTTPAQAYQANPSSPNITTGDVTGTTAGTSTASTAGSGSTTGTVAGAATSNTSATAAASTAGSWLQTYAPTAFKDLAMAGFGGL